MTLLNTINVGGTDYGITGAAIIGSCVTPAGSEIKVCTFSDTFELKAGDMLLVKFTYANTYGDGSTTYPKLQVNGTNYVMRRADGNYLQSGEWGNNATLTFLFDGTDFILPAGSGSERGSGVPLGTILAIHSNQVPDGYLPCNGVQFDTAQFAALYALLGDDHTPDLREVTLRGIGHNGTYVFDSTETDPSTGQAGTQNHDEYTLGEFKDDQLQDHSHYIFEQGTSSDRWGVPGATSGWSKKTNWGKELRTIISDTGRSGTVTRGKSVGVNYIIKATSGLPDSQQDYILNQINAERSYSTEETVTGKTWIDGKPIYRKVYTGLDITLTQGSWCTLATGLTDIETLTDLRCFTVGSGTALTPFFMYSSYINSSGALAILPERTWNAKTFIIEYTKTTPST